MLHEMVTAKGKKRHGPKKELHHLEIHAHPEGTPDSPRWIVLHNFGPEHEPGQHEFNDPEEMLSHVRKHSGTDQPEAEEGGE